MPKKTFKRYYRKNYYKKYSRVKLDIGDGITLDNNEQSSDYVKFLSKTTQPVRWLRISEILQGRGSASFQKIASMWNFYRIYAVSITATGNALNAKGGFASNGNADNAVFLCYMPSWPSASNTSPSPESIIEQPGSKALDPFGVTKIFYRSSLYGDWQSTLTTAYAVSGIAICGVQQQRTCPTFTLKITLYFQVKDRKV